MNCQTSTPGFNEPSIFDHNVFFIETSGSNSLSTRQAFAVESLARLNTDVKIYVFFTCPYNLEVNLNEPLMKKLIEYYPNVRPINLDLGQYFYETPLESWYFCSNWNHSPYAISHLSDALRFLTLFKFGGYYFDLDVIHLLPLTNRYRNFVAAENVDTTLGSAAIHLEYKHPIIVMAVKEFAQNYR